MKYQLQNNTFLKDGFPLTYHEVLTLLNASNTEFEQIKINKSKGFDVFWSLYPKKVEKKKAILKWASLKLYEHAKYTQCMNGLKTQLNSKDERFQREKQYIKSPAVYLNNECWNDEIIVKQENKKNWLTDSQVDSHARTGESYEDLFIRLTNMGFSFNKNRR